MRREFVLVPLLAVTPLLAGCGHKGSFQREVVVGFKLPAGDFNPPADAVAAVRKNCPGGPNAVPEPLPPSNAPAVSRLYGVRYNVAGADDATIATLEACLQKQPLVISAQLEDSDS